MSSIPTYTTQKKFYNKYLYKVTMRIPGVSALRYYSPAVILEKIKQKEELPTERFTGYPRYTINASDGKTLLNILEKYQGEYGKRIESFTIDIYTNNEKLYAELSEKLTDKVVHRSEPDQDQLDLYDDVNTVLCKKLPHGKYQYKVYLQPHKIAADWETRSGIIEWLQNQCPKITFTDAVQHWLKYTTQNWDRRYILVDSEQTLLMLKLRNTDLFGKVYRYVIADK